MGSGAHAGLVVEVPLHPGTLREEGHQLPGADQGGLHLAVVPSSASFIRFEIVSKEKRYDRGYQGLRFPSATTLPPPPASTETALEQPSAGVPHQTGGREQTVGRAVTHVGAQKHRSYDQTQVVPG